MKRFSEHFNVHTPVQIYLQNVENAKFFAFAIKVCKKCYHDPQKNRKKLPKKIYSWGL